MTDGSKKKTGILPLDPFKVACQAVLVLLPPRLPLIGPQIVSLMSTFRRQAETSPPSPSS